MRTPHDGQPGRDVVALRRLESEIEKGQIDVYRNLLGHPYVFFDVAGETPADTHPAVHLPLLHHDVRGWLTQFVWKAEGFLLQERELDRVLLALAGLSLRNKLDRVADPALLELLETEPTVAVVVEYMHAEKRSKLEYGMGSLWKTLHGFASERKLLVRGKKRFPAGANALSRKMSGLEEKLKQFGIRVTMTRSNGCKVLLERLDDPASPPSAGSSAPNSLADGELRSADAKQAILARLAAKRRQQSDPAPPTGGPP